jgi:hypothetical protein
VYCCDIHQGLTDNIDKVFLQDIVEQVVEHHRFDTCPTDGDVFLLISAADSHEHASRVSSHHHRSLKWTSIQLLSPMVRRHLLAVGSLINFPIVHY